MKKAKLRQEKLTQVSNVMGVPQDCSGGARARKVTLIRGADYPYEKYSAYWEIRIGGDDQEGYRWGVRIYDYASSKVVDEAVDVADTRDDADTAAQTWALERMGNYLR